MKACILVSPAPVESNPLRIVELPQTAACRRPGAGAGRCLRSVPHRPPRGRGRTRSAQIARRAGPPGGGRAWKRTGPTRRVSNRARAWASPGCTRPAACANTAGPARENLCERAVFTGWMVDGGYAEYVAAPEDFVYRAAGGLQRPARGAAAVRRHHRLPHSTAFRRRARRAPRHLRFRRRRARRHPGGAPLEHRRLRHVPRPAPSASWRSTWARCGPANRTTSRPKNSTRP